jgi:hypothetical protein
MAYTFVQEAHELSYTSASNTTIISNYAGPWSSDGISTYTGVTPSESQFATIEIDAMIRAQNSSPPGGV